MLRESEGMHSTTTPIQPSLGVPHLHSYPLEKGIYKALCLLKKSQRLLLVQPQHRPQRARHFSCQHLFSLPCWQAEEQTSWGFLQGLRMSSSLVVIFQGAA